MSLTPELVPLATMTAELRTPFVLKGTPGKGRFDGTTLTYELCEVR